MSFFKHVTIGLLCGLSLQSAFADFSDVQYSWYKDSILSLQSQGLANGYGDGRYGTENNITRAEILKLLLKASNVTLPMTTTEKCFPDVDPNMWYHPFICAAQQLGIANGFADGKFKPNDPVTSLEAITFGTKAFGITDKADAGETWYEPLQKFADDNHLMSTHGYTLGTKISRGKSADLIVRLQEYSKTKSPVSYKSVGCQAQSSLISGENTITVEGKERKYNLSVPSGYSNSKEYSLVVASHGRTNDKDRVEGYMGLDKGQSDFIIVYPAGLPSGSAFSWSEKENLTFFDAMIQQVSNNYCINRDHLFLVGHSLGGWFTQKLACLRGEEVNAMAVVGSGPYGSTCTGPATSLFFQNVNDNLSSYASGKSAEATRLKVNECSDSTETVQIGPLTCTKHNSCSAENSVTWCEGYTGYGGDPHSWPTGERGQRGYSETGGTWILQFFRGLM